MLGLSIASCLKKKIEKEGQPKNGLALPGPRSRPERGAHKGET
jgi:hypothetical protein